MNTDLHEVHLESLPAGLFSRAITYLADVLRECQLMLVDHHDKQTPVTEPAVLDLVRALVPDLEEVRDLFRRAEIVVGDDTVSIHSSMPLSTVATMAHLQMQLVQLRFLASEGGMLVPSEPEVSKLLAWVWDEASDQLHGRPSRPYH